MSGIEYNALRMAMWEAMQSGNQAIAAALREHHAETRRERIAAQMMAGMCAADGGGEYMPPETKVRHSLELADALIAALDGDGS